MPRTTVSSSGSLAAGAAVRRARQTAGLTQADVARATGASAPYITNVENGRENLTVGKLAMIAEALGHELRIQLVPVEDLTPHIPA